jgi:hypothetical protein
MLKVAPRYAALENTYQPTKRPASGAGLSIFWERPYWAAVAWFLSVATVAAATVILPCSRSSA